LIDSQILAVYKHPGLLSQSEAEQEGQEPNTSTSTIVDLARKHVGVDAVGLVHRLDRPVSGLMILGKTATATKRLSGNKDYICCLYSIICIVIECLFI
jgi:23S rRNA pseudouridine1911/1915/1917 synthase